MLKPRQHWPMLVYASRHIIIQVEAYPCSRRLCGLMVRCTSWCTTSRRLAASILACSLDGSKSCGAAAGLNGQQLLQAELLQTGGVDH